MKIYSLLITTLISTTAFANIVIVKPNIDNVVATASVNFDDDTYPDLAYLTWSEDPDKDQEDLDLWIKLSTKTEYIKIENITLSMNGGMFGMGTKLITNDLGSLQIISYNDSVGRGRWEETITLAFRNNSVVLAGYTYIERDTLDGSYGKCDVNVLSKKGIYESSTDYTSSKTTKANFKLSPSDVLNLKDLSSSRLQETYLTDYCYTINEAE